ncbi:MAG: DNA repair protein RecO [Candidatus Kerfeldbacteria bacterium]|nr:DNA repair protein RecO [Candidatus Kerfeldbacteria bacterium]
MSSTYLANGVVLRHRDHRDYDRIITVFSDEYGKIDAVARGVRKPLSKLAGHLEPFSYSAFMFATGRSFDVLATSVKRSSYRIPQTDVLSYGLACSFFEAADRLTRPRQPDEPLFRLLVRFLETFEQSLDPHGGSAALQRVLITEFFLVQLIIHLGFAPSLDRCVVGKEPLPETGVVLDMAHGGLVCDSHRSREGNTLPIGRQTVEMLRLMADGAIEPIRFATGSRDTVAEVARAVNTMITYHLGEPLTSRAFVREMLKQT